MMSKIIIPLYGHQEIAVNNMKNRERGQLYCEYQNKYLRSNLGLLSDKPGSGKSLMILALLVNNDKIDGYLDSRAQKVFRYTDKLLLDDNGQTSNLPYYNFNVIIVPNNILYQWISYVEEQTTLTYHVEQDLAFDEIKKETEIVFLTEDKLNQFLRLPIEVKRIVIDEIDSINLQISNAYVEVKCRFMWFVTGTPNRFLEGRLSETNSTLERGRKIANYSDFSKCMFLTMPNEVLTKLLVKNDENFVKKCLGLQQPAKKTIICRRPAYFEVVKEFGLSDIEGCLINHDFQSISKLLKCTVSTPKDLFEKMITRHNMEIESHKKIYQSIVDSRRNEDQRFASINNEEDLEVMKQAIAKVEERLEVLHQRIREIEKESCSVCYTDYFDGSMGSPVFLTCCRHIICVTCFSLLKQKGNNCPYCRNPNPQSVLLADKTVEIDEDYFEDGFSEFNKLETMLKILEDNLGAGCPSKFLIFSSHPGSFLNIKEQLDLKGYKYYILNRKDDVSTVIERFNNGSISILLLNAMTHGFGLNLQAATDIVIFHRVDSYIEEQIIGRGNRLGHIGQLNVHHLLYEEE